MARDITTSVRLEGMLDKFLAHIAKNDRRAKGSLFAMALEDFANDHGYAEWLEENSVPRIPNKKLD